MKSLRWATLGVLALLAGCASRPLPPPEPEPVRRPPALRPMPRPMPPPAPREWQDLPLTRGGWTYSSDGSGSQAQFGEDGGEASFVLRCERAGRQIALFRSGGAADARLTIRTSSTARTLAGRTLPASDPLLDAIAFSRGRFTVETPGLPMLVIPAWPEPARVVEDCRG